MSGIWAGAWVLAWLPVLIYAIYLPRARFDQAFLLPSFWQMLVPPAVWGALSGATFAGFVAALGSRKGWSSLGIRHALTWGALSGLAGPIVLGALLVGTAGRIIWTDMRILIVIALVSVIVNGALAAGTIALAKRGEATS